MSTFRSLLADGRIHFFDGGFGLGPRRFGRRRMTSLAATPTPPLTSCVTMALAVGISRPGRPRAPQRLSRHGWWGHDVEEVEDRPAQSLDGARLLWKNVLDMLG